MTHSYSKASVKPKLFIIADAGADTGFANVTHNIVDHLYTKWDIHILAINYQGDPHEIQTKAKMYNPSAKVQGDYYGLNRVAPLLAQIKPDLVFMINDTWVAAGYLPLFKNYKGPKIVYTPIDALNLKKEYITPMNEFDHVIAYTHFGLDQMTDRGLTTASSVIPHGINTKLYKPIDRAEARKRNGFPDDWFIVNVTDRNQIRKRIDLAFYKFKVWVEETDKPDSVKIHYHGALQDAGWDIMDLAQELGIKHRLIITAPNITAQNGLPLHLMPYVYAPADVGWSECMGEGWGMTIHERMVMKIPMIVPKHSALAEWPNGGVHYTEISNLPLFNIGGLNTRGSIATLESSIAALELMYTNEEYRHTIAEAGYTIGTQKQFQWNHIAHRFDTVFKETIRIHKEKQYGLDTSTD